MSVRHRPVRVVSSVASIAMVATMGSVGLVGLATSAATATDASPGPALRLTTTNSRPDATTGRVGARRAGFTAFPVPTSAAGLDNIVTAPNGDMWFEMEDVNKVGRITAAGAITEYGLGETTTGDGSVVDLTVASDGSVWVVYDSGWRIMRIHPDLSNATPYSLGAYPYGENVEMGPDGVPWVSMRFDKKGLARVLPTGMVWDSNSPPCDGVVARAQDGGMWCQSDLNTLIRSNADATGGTSYPLPSRATDVRSMAAGPVGSIWFSRYSATMLTSPARGDVGWVDQATGATTIFDTGSRTGPTGLVQGPDNAMWFVNRGSGAGIGHVDAQGRGAITKVGNYEPNKLTFDQQGWLWFTDDQNNSIVRVDPAGLQVTDVEVGEGSVFAPGPQAPGTQPPGTTKASAKAVGKVKAGKKPLRVKRNKVRIAVTCPKASKAGCRGVAMIRHKKKSRVLSAVKSYRIKAGKQKTVSLKLNKVGRKSIKRKVGKVRATLVTPAGDAVRDKVIRLRR